MTTRQEKVVQMLIDGFGDRIQDAPTLAEDGIAYVVVSDLKGRFAIDKFGEIGEIPEMSDELAYLIDLDMRSLDILEAEKAVKEEGE